MLRAGFFARRDFLLASNREKKTPHRTTSENGNRTASYPMADFAHFSTKNHATKNPIVSKYSPRPRARYCRAPWRSCRSSFRRGGSLLQNERRRFSLEGEATIIREYQNTLLILSIELTYTLTPKLLIHRKYTGMTQTLDCVIHSCLG